MKSLVQKIAIAAAASGLAAIAHAVPVLSFNDGINPVITVTDNIAPDNNGTVGIVGFNGSVGSWSLASATSFTKPNFGGTAAKPNLDTAFSVGTNVAGTLTISFIDDNFSVPAGSGYAGQINGNFSFGAGTVTYSAFVNGVQVFSTGPMNSNYGVSSLGFSAAAGSVLEQRLVITAGAGGVSTSGDAILQSVPDSGNTLALLGAGLAGLGIAARRRKSAS